MKLNASQLNAHLIKTLAPIYLVSGEELILKQEVLQTIRQAAKKAGFQERTRVTPEHDLSEHQLYSFLHAASLFANKRLLEMDFRNDAPAKPLASLLQMYADAPPPDTILLINIGKADDKIARSSWYKAIDKTGVLIALWPLTRDQLALWLQTRARKYHLQFKPDAISLLVDHVEGNLIAAAQTMEKIYLLQPQQLIDIHFLQNFLLDESHFTIFDFSDSLLAGDAARAFHILATLQETGVDPILILWGIARELRRLAEMAEQVAHGVSYPDLFKQHRIFAQRQKPLLRFLKNFTLTDCQHFLADVTDMDRIVKGAMPGNIWQRLQLFCLRLLQDPVRDC